MHPPPLKSHPHRTAQPVPCGRSACPLTAGLCSRRLRSTSCTCHHTKPSSPRCLCLKCHHLTAWCDPALLQNLLCRFNFARWNSEVYLLISMLGNSSIAHSGTVQYTLSKVCFWGRRIQIHLIELFLDSGTELKAKVLTVWGHRLDLKLMTTSLYEYTMFVKSLKQSCKQTFSLRLNFPISVALEPLL